MLLVNLAKLENIPPQLQLLVPVAKPDTIQMSLGVATVKLVQQVLTPLLEHLHVQLALQEKSPMVGLQTVRIVLQVNIQWQAHLTARTVRQALFPIRQELQIVLPAQSVNILTLECNHA